MKFMKFDEYLARNKKLVTTAPVKTVADFEGSVDVKPAKEAKHADAGGKGQVGSPEPYKKGGDVDPNKGKLKDGFADKGDKKLKYEPKNGKPEKEGGSKKATWPKTKMQEWLGKTKDMSLAEFTKHIREQKMKGLDECACQSPHTSIQDAVAICKCNKNHVSSLVREMKRNGLFNKLVREMAEHPETFKALATLIERDETYARRMARAINEAIGPPMGGDEMGGPDMGMGNDAPMPFHKKKKKPLPMGDELGGEDMGDEDLGDDLDAPEEDMGDEEEFGDEDMDDEGEEGMDDPSADPTGEDPMADMSGEGPPAPPHDKIGKLPHKKHKSKLFSAMQDQPSLGM